MIAAALALAVLAQGPAALSPKQLDRLALASAKALSNPKGKLRG